MRRIYFLAVATGALVAHSSSYPSPVARPDHAAGPLAETAPGAGHTGASCPAATGLAQALSTGAPPESLPAGACLMRAAHGGDIAAARRLGDAYAGALALHPPGHGPSPDLFGRQIMWRRAAAASGLPQDEIMLAQALDFDRQAIMPEAALAYYFRAARQGAHPAANAVARAWAQGRIYPDKITAFRLWLQAQAPSTPALSQAAELIGSTPDTQT
jgi:hypothetical protein